MLKDLNNLFQIIIFNNIILHVINMYDEMLDQD